MRSGNARGTGSPEAPGSAARPWRARLAALALGLAGALLAVEIGVRIVEIRRAGPSLREALARHGEPEGGTALWIQALRLVDNDRIAYALRPNFDARVSAAGRAIRIATNSLGFRGPEFTLEKPPGTLRIVGLGDSMMFGWGVAYDSTYVAHLGRLLAERFPARRHEVISLAVGGYNTVQEVEMLRTVGLELAPDVVIVHLYDNDANGIIYTDARPSAWGIDRSFAYERLLLRESPAASLAHAGMAEFRAAFEELRALQRQHGFRLLVLTHAPSKDVEPLLAVPRELGIDTLDLGAKAAEHALAQGFRDYFRSRLVLPKDGHPSERHHRLLAAELLDALFERGWVGGD